MSATARHALATPGNGPLEALRRGDLAGARELRFTGTLTAFPREIFGLAETLEVLDLGSGTLDALPHDMGRLHRLRVLFCSRQRFARLPPALGDCPALSQIGCRSAEMREVPGEALPRPLRWLTLTDNAIEELPAALGDRPHLQKLMLSGNRLRGLPSRLAGAPNLELLRIAANRFATLPPWLSELPRLAWMAWAGNPFERDPPGAVFDRVPWSRLEPGALLGEGASGRVHAAVWRDAADGRRPVALKLFKGAMTSDGLPEREMAASLAAGAHPNLTGALARITDHPEGADGLVMPLLPADWRVLAGPPSLATCSRDVYDPALSLPANTALRIARNVAAATAHLHARGIMHGDLYAHNVMWDGLKGDAVLSDFGGACALPEGVAGRAWQRVEVRAFGLLLGELLDRCGPVPEALHALAQACAGPRPGDRPDMADVVRRLDEAALQDRTPA